MSFVKWKNSYAGDYVTVKYKIMNENKKCIGGCCVPFEKVEDLLKELTEKGAWDIVVGQPFVRS